MLGWQQPPHRTTIARRYKALYEVIKAFVLFIGQQHAADLSEQFNLAHLVADKSLFKARGPVWHQVDRKAGVVPNHLRNLDTDATWSKSGIMAGSMAMESHHPYTRCFPNTDDRAWSRRDSAQLSQWPIPKISVV